MESLTIFEIAKRINGGITAVGETGYDEECKRRIEEWDDLLYRIIKMFVESAKGEAGRYNASVKEVSDKSREKLQWLHTYIGGYLEEWKKEE